LSDVSNRRRADLADRALYVAIGRIPDLHGSPWEGPETARKPSLHCERETGSTDRGGASRCGFGHETDLARLRQTHTGRGRHRSIRLLVGPPGTPALGAGL
jgi:hypothetical protein